jgi:hypothetical protein
MKIEFKITVDSRNMLQPFFDEYKRIRGSQCFTYEEFENAVMANDYLFDKVKKLALGWMNIGLDDFDEYDDVYDLARCLPTQCKYIDNIINCKRIIYAI